MNIEHLCMGCMEDKGDNVVCPSCGWKEGAIPETSVQLKPRTVLNNHYLLGRVLGQGGFGITYLAWDMNIKRKVAIKEYFPDGFATRAGDHLTVSVYNDKKKSDFDYGLSKFIEEARALAKFQDHPGIVSVIAFFKANNTGYLVMEYVEGMTFKSYLEQESGKIPFETAYKILMPVMDALREIHDTGLLHRDISPDNIYISKKGPVKLLDFGAARFAMGEYSRSLSVILKDGYAPEEQYRSRGGQGPWTDVYALGATFYRAITGISPPQALDRLEKDDLQSPGELGISIPGAVEYALMKSLAVKANNRQQNMKEFQDMLKQGNTEKKNTGTESDEAAFKFAEKMNTIEAYTIFLENHPQGNYAPEAEKRLNELRRIEMEKQKKGAEVFEMARKIDTIKAYTVFLEDFPDGDYALLAKKRISELTVKDKNQKGKKKIREENPNSPPGIGSKANMGAIWLIFSITVPIISTIFFNMTFRGYGSINERETAILTVIILVFFSGIVMAFLRRKVMDGVEIACYWMGLSLMSVIIFAVVFKLKEGGVIVSTMISMLFGLYFVLKRRKIADGTEIALYWFGLSGAIVGFFIALFEDARYSWTSGNSDRVSWGAFIALLIVITLGIIIIIKRKKIITGFEAAIYWLGFSVGLFFFFPVLFTITALERSINFVFFMTITASLVTGAILVFKRGKEISGFLLFFYWFWLSGVLTLFFPILLILIDRWAFRNGTEGVVVGILLSLISGVTILIKRRKKT